MRPRFPAIALLAVGLSVLISGTASATPSARRINEVMRDVKRSVDYRAHIFTVHQHGRPIVVGAAGSSQNGVPANTRMHFRTGNTGESMEATALYRLAEKGKVRLDAPLSRWYPNLPNASRVTLRMLANSVSGYNDFITTDAWLKKFYENPFRVWSAYEVLRYAFSKPPLFEPGANWRFSDTNYVLLGQVLSRIAHKSPERVVNGLVLKPLRLNHTALDPLTPMPRPTLHGYTNERGFYEEATFWTTSYGRGGFDGYSTIADLARWARARSRGTLLSRDSRRAFFAPDTAGLGPNTRKLYFVNNTINDSGWSYNNPNISGYSLIVAHHRPTDISVAVVATLDPTSNASIQYATLVFKRLAQLLTPNQVPVLQPCPRGGC